MLISFWISCIKFELILTLETGIMVAWFQLEYSIRFFRYVAFSRVLETSIAIEVSKSLRWLGHIFPIGQFSSARNTMIFDGLEIETERTKNIYFSFSRAHRTHRMYFIVCLGIHYNQRSLHLHLISRILYLSIFLYVINHFSNPFS